MENTACAAPARRTGEKSTGWGLGQNSAPNLFADLGMTLPWCPHQGPKGPQTDDSFL